MAPEWKIVLVNVGEKEEEVEKFIQEVGWAGEVLLEHTSKLSKVFLVLGYPTTILLTRDCRLALFFENEVVAYQIIGGRKWDDPRMVQFFKETAEKMREEPPH